MIGIDLITTNLGMSIDLIIFLLFTILSILFFALDFKIGLMFELITQAILFMWFYSVSYINDFRLPLITFMITLVLFALSLYFVKKVTIS